MPTLRLILGDQLNPQHSWFGEVRPDVTYVLLELRQETDYVRHHIQKVVAFFAAMRSFADTLREQGHTVRYQPLDAPSARGSLTDTLFGILEESGCDRFEYLLPDEWRLDQQLLLFCSELNAQGIASQAYDTEHFLTTRADLAVFFKGKKTYLMESFYRKVRRDYDILLEDGKPVGGKWNFDAENRKALPRKHVVPAPLFFEKDVTALVHMIEQQGVQTIGRLDEPGRFIWPTTRDEALQLLDYFAENLLRHFGDYQDAMQPGGWSLYHSRLSFVLNVKLLHPLEVVQRAIAQWQREPEVISLSQLEGFVRQIIGWREYMRGIYWAEMPGFARLNYFGHTRPLPQWYWTGQTRMNCLRDAVGQSLEYAYAHHIQRLMVTGNFALLAGVSPDQLDEWYLGIYIDAIEWVEITNTRGMSQFADGGLVGTKPYVSSASYIHKMSHYCGGCYYDKAKKVGERACPFNSLYWHFYHRNTNLLAKNPRIGMMYKVWEGMTDEARTALLDQADRYLDQIESL